MKYIFEKELNYHVKLIFEGFQEFEEGSEEFQHLPTFFHYLGIYNKNEKVMYYYEQLMKDWDPQPGSALYDWVVRAKREIEEAEDRVKKEIEKKMLESSKNETKLRIQKMIKMGFPYDQIAAVFDLTEEEVQKIAKDRKNG